MHHLMQPMQREPVGGVKLKYHCELLSGSGSRVGNGIVHPFTQTTACYSFGSKGWTLRQAKARARKGGQAKLGGDNLW